MALGKMAPRVMGDTPPAGGLRLLCKFIYSRHRVCVLEHLRRGEPAVTGHTGHGGWRTHSHSHQRRCGLRLRRRELLVAVIVLCYL